MKTDRPVMNEVTAIVQQSESQQDDISFFLLKKKRCMSSPRTVMGL